MKNAALCSSIVSFLLASGASGVRAAQPPDIVVSDTAGNTAMGTGALSSVTPSPFSDAGVSNTASGAGALSADTTGSFNAAFGVSALFSNTTGLNNTAVGTVALFFNSTGTSNTALGVNSLGNNKTGFGNTASGSFALAQNKTGDGNTASGNAALYSNTSGHNNTASGSGALATNTIGSNNIALGAGAGSELTRGSNNIEIGNAGDATDIDTIKIGVEGQQTRTFIAGIENAKVTGAAVYVTSAGRLGVLASSERYKTGVAPMGVQTEKLSSLRPVSFHLKSEPNGAVQYGLIAEEVDTVYPELVIRDAQGLIQGVRYDELAPMLLNVVQQQNAKLAADERTIEAQADRIAQLGAETADIRAELKRVNAQVQAALAQAQAQNTQVAMR